MRVLIRMNAFLYTNYNIYYWTEDKNEIKSDYINSAYFVEPTSAYLRYDLTDTAGVPEK